MREQGIEFASTFVLGGQIGSESPRPFQRYAAGRFIGMTCETRHLQIGESRYGNPIDGRIVRPESPRRDGARCALLSKGSTVGSNRLVGLPLDLTICRREASRAELRLDVTGADEYLRKVRSNCSEALRQALRGLPDPPWG